MDPSGSLVKSVDPFSEPFLIMERISQFRLEATEKLRYNIMVFFIQVHKLPKIYI